MIRRDEIEEIQSEHVSILLTNIHDESRIHDVRSTRISNDFKKQTYECDLCGIKTPSSGVLLRHMEGKKHQIRMERQGKTFGCELCDVNANSQLQLESHLKSIRHKNRLYRKEHGYGMLNEGFWIIVICLVCVFLNFLLLVKYIFSTTN